MNTETGTMASGEPKKDRLKLTVVTTAGKWEAHFQETALVSEVIAATLDHFKNKLNQNDTYVIQLKGSEANLAETASLKDQGVEDGDTLVMSKATIGGGK